MATKTVMAPAVSAALSPGTSHALAAVCWGSCEQRLVGDSVYALGEAPGGRWAGPKQAAPKPPWALSQHMSSLSLSSHLGQHQLMSPQSSVGTDTHPLTYALSPCPMPHHTFAFCLASCPCSPDCHQARESAGLTACLAHPAMPGLLAGTPGHRMQHRQPLPQPSGAWQYVCQPYG